MRRSEVVHLAGALITALCLLASSPVAAQYKMVPLSDGNGLQVDGMTKSSTATPTKATVTANISACLGSLGAFAIEGFSGPPNTTVVFKVAQTVSGVLGFSNSSSGPFTDTIDILVPLDATGNGESEPFYLNGVGLGQTVVSICNEQQYCVWNQASAIVVNVASIEWEAVHSPLDNNPNAGGGLRIFPEKTSPGDTATDKTMVVVKVALSAEHSKAVYLEAFDVDDPSTDNTVIDRDGPGGIDNNGTTPSIDPNGGTGFASGLTGPDGVARFTFQVSKQPGDNFRIAGACLVGDRDGLKVNGVGIEDALDQPLPTDRAKITPMLTVWRRLHIEKDSMEPVPSMGPQVNFVEGTVTKAANPSKGQTKLTLSALDDYPRFETGRITIDGVGSFPVVGSSTKTVTVQGTVADADATNKHFTLVDDDDFNDNDGENLHGDIGEDLTEPNTDWVMDSDDPAANVFAPAYVRPTYDLSNPTPKAPFILNYAGTGNRPIITYNGFDNKGTSGDLDFWTDYLLGAYQAPTDEDGDGDTTTLWGYGGVDGASVFLEAGRPSEESRYADKAAFVNQAATTAHELGHWFQQDDCTKTQNKDPEGGLMCWPNVRKKGTFSAMTLNLIRRKYLPISPAATSAYASVADEAPKGLSIEAYASKQDYALGEVVRLTIKITNVSSHVIEIPEIPGLTNGLISLFVAEKEGFREYQWPGAHSDVDGAGVRIAPGKVLETEATIYRNRRELATEYAFMKAGTYRVKAVVFAGDAELVSQPVAIRVHEPKGVDLEVWKVLQANPDLGYFVQLDTPNPYLSTAERTALVKALSDLTGTYPDSRQAEDIRLSLIKYKDALQAFSHSQQEQ
jgi:hypothetical protein